jgi:hypothetical protein
MTVRCFATEVLRGLDTSSQLDEKGPGTLPARHATVSSPMIQCIHSGTFFSHLIPSRRESFSASKFEELSRIDS